MKRAKLRAQVLQRLCSCGNPLGDHTPNEIIACFHRERVIAGKEILGQSRDLGIGVTQMRR